VEKERNPDKSKNIRRNMRIYFSFHPRERRELADLKLETHVGLSLRTRKTEREITMQVGLRHNTHAIKQPNTQ
jgi:hypothetical protein